MRGHLWRTERGGRERALSRREKGGRGIFVCLSGEGADGGSARADAAGALISSIRLEDDITAGIIAIRGRIVKDDSKATAIGIEREAGATDDRAASRAAIEGRVILAEWVDKAGIRRRIEVGVGLERCSVAADGDNNRFDGCGYRRSSGAGDRRRRRRRPRFRRRLRDSVRHRFLLDRRGHCLRCRCRCRDALASSRSYSGGGGAVAVVTTTRTTGTTGTTTMVTMMEDRTFDVRVFAGGEDMAVVSVNNVGGSDDGRGGCDRGEDRRGAQKRRGRRPGEGIRDGLRCGDSLRRQNCLVDGGRARSHRHRRGLGCVLRGRGRARRVHRRKITAEKNDRRNQAHD